MNSMREPNDAAEGNTLSDEESAREMVELLAEDYVAVIQESLSSLPEWESLPYETRVILIQAEALWPVCAVTENYGDIAVNYGKAVESLLRRITHDRKKNLNQFASEIERQPQWLKLFLSASCPPEMIRVISEQIIEINDLRNAGAHSQRREPVNASQARNAHRALYGELSATRQKMSRLESALRVLLKDSDVPGHAKEEIKDYLRRLQILEAAVPPVRELGLMALLIRYSRAPEAKQEHT